MRLLLDQDIYPITIAFLQALGHDILTAEGIGLSRATDRQLLQTANQQGRIFLTRDRDFGNLVFVAGLSTGVIYLRMSFRQCEIVHRQLAALLAKSTQETLMQTFVVISPTGIRVRQLRNL